MQQQRNHPSSTQQRVFSSISRRIFLSRCHGGGGACGSGALGSSFCVNCESKFSESAEVVGAWYGLNPCPAPTNSADSEDFDSQLTENEDPCAPEPLAPPPPWHADPQILKQIDEVSLRCVDEGWFRRDCMERVLGLAFEDAMDVIMAHIASHLARFDTMYIGVTSQPYKRWHEIVDFVGHKYVYEGLDCLYVHPKSHACHQGSGGAMERKLIDECRARGWPIENKPRSKGGECATGSPSFVYLAWSTS